jgi:hypothetical protein
VYRTSVLLSNEEVDEQAPSESAKSEALQIFLKNFVNITCLARLMPPPHRQWTSVHDAVEGLMEFKGQFTTMPLSDLESRTTDLNAAVEEFTKVVELITFLNDWMLVMMVSFTEAYLEDVLIQLVGHNPEWMDDLKLKVSYAEVATASSLPEHMETIQRRWQECWVNNILRKKPRHWIKILERLGANGYPAGLAEHMTTVWDCRHGIVHSSATRHLSVTDIQKFVGVVFNFVGPTDRFVVNCLSGHPLT